MLPSYYDQIIDHPGAWKAADLSNKDSYAFDLTKRHYDTLDAAVVKVKRVIVTLSRSDGKTLVLKAKNIRPGKAKAVKVKQPFGVFGYKARFDIVWAKGKPSYMTTSFKLIRVQKLRLLVQAKDVDMDARRVTFRMTNPAKRVTFVIFASDGGELHRIDKDLSGAVAMSPLTLTWPALKGKVLRMELKVYDIAGLWTGVRITPFTISIPHEEVEFASGRHGIRASEAPKLRDTMRRIRAELAKHGTLLQLKLFVAGYTDTVGGRGYNKGLSTRRARAIGAWFRRNGLRIPIYYQGFGEAVLAKQTPDNTPEPANRRALYILSSQKPAVSKQTPGTNWKKL